MSGPGCGHRLRRRTARADLSRRRRRLDPRRDRRRHGAGATFPGSSPPTPSCVDAGGATARYFWKPRHARLALALAGAATRRPLVALVAALPWALEAMPAYGSSPRGRVRALSELPEQLVLDAIEMAGMIAGSVRHRTVFL